MIKYLLAAVAALTLSFSTPVYAAVEASPEVKTCPNKTVKEQLEISMKSLEKGNVTVLNFKAYDAEAAHDLMHKIRDVLKFQGIPEDDSYDSAGVIQVEKGYFVLLGKGECFHSSGLIPNAGWKLMFGQDA